LKYKPKRDQHTLPGYSIGILRGGLRFSVHIFDVCLSAMFLTVRIDTPNQRGHAGSVTPGSRREELPALAEATR
jgi:hypothetical protein